VFPEVLFGWTDYGKRLLITFPDGCTTSIWEPNFFFSFPSFPIDYLFDQVVTHIAGAHQQLMTTQDSV
jgi:hypothetical protein